MWLGFCLALPATTWFLTIACSLPYPHGLYLCHVPGWLIHLTVIYLPLPFTTLPHHTFLPLYHHHHHRLFNSCYSSLPFYLLQLTLPTVPHTHTTLQPLPLEPSFGSTSMVLAFWFLHPSSYHWDCNILQFTLYHNSIMGQLLTSLWRHCLFVEQTLLVPPCLPQLTYHHHTIACGSFPLRYLPTCSLLPAHTWDRPFVALPFNMPGFPVLPQQLPPAATPTCIYTPHHHHLFGCFLACIFVALAYAPTAYLLLFLPVLCTATYPTTQHRFKPSCLWMGSPLVPGWVLTSPSPTFPLPTCSSPPTTNTGFWFTASTLRFLHTPGACNMPRTILLRYYSPTPHMQTTTYTHTFGFYLPYTLILTLPSHPSSPL